MVFPMLALVAQLPHTEQAATTSKRSFKDATVEIELRAVCKITEEGATCWDMERKPAPNIARQVEEIIQQWTPSGSFKLHRKNRILVVRSSRPLSVKVGGFDYRHNASQEISWASLTFEMSASLGEVELAWNSPAAPEPLTVSTAPGSITKLERFTMTAGDPVKTDRQSFFDMGSSVISFGRRPEPESRWIQPFELKIGGASPHNAVLQDSDGNPIKYVDELNKPVSELTVANEAAKLAEEARQRGLTNPPASRFRRAVAFWDWQPGEIAQVMYNVAPQYVQAIRFEIQRTRSVRFTNIPLDPKR